MGVVLAATPTLQIRTETRQPMAAKNKEPYKQSYYPPVPTGFTKYMRNSLPWQFIRFWIINYKIFKLLVRSSHN